MTETIEIRTFSSVDLTPLSGVDVVTVEVAAMGPPGATGATGPSGGGGGGATGALGGTPPVYQFVYTYGGLSESDPPAGSASSDALPILSIAEWVFSGLDGTGGDWSSLFGYIGPAPGTLTVRGIESPELWAVWYIGSGGFTGSMHWGPLILLAISDYSDSELSFVVGESIIVTFTPALIPVHLLPGQAFEVQDSFGQPILQLDEATGDLHLKNGATITYEL